MHSDMRNPSCGCSRSIWKLEQRPLHALHAPSGLLLSPHHSRTAPPWRPHARDPHLLMRRGYLSWAAAVAVPVFERGLPSRHRGFLECDGALQNGWHTRTWRKQCT